MIPAPSLPRLHLAALALLVVASVFAWLAQERPRPGFVAPAAAVDHAPASAVLLFGRQLDLNRADADDLAALPGIGPVRAARIVEARAARGGRFDAVDDLLEVSGIGPVTLARLRDSVRVGNP